MIHLFENMYPFFCPSMQSILSLLEDKDPPSDSSSSSSDDEIVYQSGDENDEVEDQELSGEEVIEEIVRYFP